jgi:hypothetical protein
MYNTHCDEILPGDNVIIGLGDSFTQGVGTYSLETWASIPENPAMYNISGQRFIEEQGQNNWVRQLVRNHLPGYKTFNLGINGAGNRAAVKELYLNPLPKNLNNVVVILMCTGIERFDFLKQSDATAGINWHQKWQTIWPTYSDRGPISRLEKEYFEQIWSRRSDALELLFTLKDAENFCKANGYKFVFASAFDKFINKKVVAEELQDKVEHLNMIDWDNFISTDNYYSIMDMVNQLENPEMPIIEIHQHYAKLPMPTKYITPCAHWSQEGSKYVANFIYEQLKKRNII